MPKDFEGFTDFSGRNGERWHEAHGIGSGGWGEQASGGQLSGEMNGGGETFRHPEGLDVEPDTEQEAFSADFRDGGMLPGRDGFANGALVPEGTCGELLVDHLAEDRNASGAGERTATEG